MMLSSWKEGGRREGEGGGREEGKRRERREGGKELKMRDEKAKPSIQVLPLKGLSSSREGVSFAFEDPMQ